MVCGRRPVSCRDGDLRFSSASSRTFRDVTSSSAHDSLLSYPFQFTVRYHPTARLCKADVSVVCKPTRSKHLGSWSKAVELCLVKTTSAVLECVAEPRVDLLIRWGGSSAARCWQERTCCCLLLYRRVGGSVQAADVLTGAA